MTENKGAETRRFPSLEFETASWALHFFAKNLCAKNKEERARRIGKLVPLQSAITDGVLDGRIPYFPPEAVTDEYFAVKAQATQLFECLRKSNADNCSKLLWEAELDYKIDSPCLEIPRGTRPLWLYGKCEEDVSDVALSVLEGGIGRDQFVREAAGQLLGYKPRSLRDAVDKAEGSATKRVWKTSPVQRYLVAMLVLASKQEDPDVEGLSLILRTLLRSQYKALAIYHLARGISVGQGGSDDLPMRGGAIDWAVVKLVCEQVTVANREWQY